MQLCQSEQNISICNQANIRTFSVNLFLSKMALFYRRHHTRKQLAQLSASQLNDAGISPEQALNEIEKPFWK